MKIYDRVHQLRIQFSIIPETARYACVYITMGKEGCYLIGTGVEGYDKKIGEYIHKFGKNRENIDAVLLTHSHPDYTGAPEFIKEGYSCCVYADRGEKDWIEDIDLQYEERPIPSSCDLVDGSVSVDSTLSDGDLLYLELGITIQIIGASGHSRGSLCFYYREEKILFVGDAIPDLSDALIYEDSYAGGATLGRLEGLEKIDLYCPAWGKVYDRRIGMHMVHGGRSRISKIRKCTEAYRGRIQEEGPQKLLESICEESSMAEYKKDPMPIRSVVLDLGWLDQENHRNWEGLDIEKYEKWEKLKISVDICWSIW